MSHYKPYPAYKDSGVEWLGNLPENWVVKPLKWLGTYENSNIDKKSYEGQAQVRLCNYTDVYNNEFIINSMEFMVATASDSEIASMTVRKGDIIITKDSEDPTDIGVPALVTENLDNVVCGYHLTVIRVPQSYQKFIFRLIQSAPTKARFYVESPGVTRYGLNQDAIGGIPLVLPPSDEAEALASYMEDETARIDALVAKKTRFIELLREKRQAIITHAVTKGLDPNVKMKDSGVEWLGEVPEHWSVRQMKSGIKSLQNGVWGDEPTGGADDVPCARVADFDRIRLIVEEPLPTLRSIPTAQRVYKIVRPGDLLLEKSGGGEQTTVGAMVQYVGESEVVCSNFVAVVKCKEDISARWLCYVNSHLYALGVNTRSIKQTTGIQNLDSNQYISEPVAFPTYGEQQAIATYLDRETARIDALIQKTKRSIELLKERRSALITAAVTGQIDLREAA